MVERKGYSRNERKPNTVGDALTKMRVDQGFTQQYVARRIGISSSLVCKLENDNVRNPRFDILVGFALACGVRPDRILDVVHQIQLPLLSALRTGDVTPLELPSLENLEPDEEEMLRNILASVRQTKRAAIEATN